MHELGITRSVVSIVSEQAKGAKVLRVTLEIGKLAAILPDAVRFCFDVCAQGTSLEGAALEIIETPGRARCRGCGAETALEQPYGRCAACGSAELELLAGEELKIKEMEVAPCA
ncbi:hydrogenase maturation nickel metallochaperone HypA [Sinimarinibacterium flocculans]|uniref:Hydrogenase maturation factor HypA n=1 Tax=Sinimarinibacterium flocculans TaxID=985250 RepID=A0A318E646_9GAMM|nr:hydrogenase maturation nickel metallochaperone HypA [Sinimarinibacterium flocculans]PXV65695.1 hydrogenase nickel incorporation protein HypA/HybF [Sinimarinibacterium flocculans]